MKTLKEKIKDFLFTPSIYYYGDGCGDGYGDSYGNGEAEYGYEYDEGFGYGYGGSSGEGNENRYDYLYGTGDGYGYGAGCGDGYGYGTGCGYASGSGKQLTYINKYKINIINGTNIIIYDIKDNVAQVDIVNQDLTLTPYYIVKNENKFSKGKTIKEALKSMEENLKKTEN